MTDFQMYVCAVALAVLLALWRFWPKPKPRRGITVNARGQIIKGWSDVKTLAPGDIVTVELNGLLRPIVHVEKS